MKILFVIFGILLLTECERINYELEQTYTVPTGKHESNFPVIRDGTKIMCRVQFNESAIYDLKCEDQADWNKLIGLMVGIDPHKNSARWVWRYNVETSLIDYGTYTYVNGDRIMNYIFSLPVSAKPELVIEYDKYHKFWLYCSDAIISPVNVYCDRFDEKNMTWLGLYFGGDKVAPHDISITYYFDK